MPARTARIRSSGSCSIVRTLRRGPQLPLKRLSAASASARLSQRSLGGTRPGQLGQVDRARARLLAEIHKLGYTGSANLMVHYLNQGRTERERSVARVVPYAKAPLCRR
jgi:hypothetical protein